MNTNKHIFKSERRERTEKTKKPPSVNAEDRPSGLADDSASLGFGFSFVPFFRFVGVCLARRSVATPTCKGTSTRHGAKKDFFDKKVDVFQKL